MIVQPVRDALDYYRRLNEATREERLHRKSIVEIDQQHAQSPNNDGATAVPKPNSNTNVKMKKSLSLSFQQNRSRYNLVILFDSADLVFLVFDISSLFKNQNIHINVSIS